VKQRLSGYEFRDPRISPSFTCQAGQREMARPMRKPPHGARKACRERVCTCGCPYHAKLAAAQQRRKEQGKEEVDYLHPPKLQVRISRLRTSMLFCLPLTPSWACLVEALCMEVLGH